MSSLHPRDQLQIIVSNSRENWEQVDIYGLMYALGLSLPPEKENEIRNEFINRFMPWRHLMSLMAEDVLCGDIPEMSHYKEVLSFYRNELYQLYPEIFLSAAKKIERHKYFYRTEPGPPPRQMMEESDNHEDTAGDESGSEESNNEGSNEGADDMEVSGPATNTQSMETVTSAT